MLRFAVVVRFVAVLLAVSVAAVGQDTPNSPLKNVAWTPRPSETPLETDGRGVHPTVLQQAAKLPDVDRWESSIKAFEDQDQKTPPTKRANVFVGSSSIRMWKLDASFPKRVCLNRGFGGSQLGDSVRYADRIVTPYQPRVVVVYAGDNDLNAGKSPETVFADYRAFRDTVHAALPESKLVFISIKPSPSRWKLREKALEANRLIREEIARGKHQAFVDVWTPMLGDDGMPRPELFVKDQLHMNETGYAIWNKLLEPHLADQ